MAEKFISYVKSGNMPILECRCGYWTPQFDGYVFGTEHCVVDENGNRTCEPVTCYVQTNGDLYCKRN